MNLLLMDTSTKRFSIAIAQDNEVLSYRNVVLNRMLESSIIPAIDQILKKVRIPLRKIDGFAVGLGPGSFTSLRVGLSTIKGFALATGQPVVGVSSLDVIAEGVRHLTSSNICVVCDAKRNLVYACVYAFKGEQLRPISDYQLISIQELLKQVTQDVLFVGDGIKLYEREIKGKRKSGGDVQLAEEKYWYPQAKHLASLAWPQFQNKKFDNIDRLTPMYLYPEDCQVRQ